LLEHPDRVVGAENRHGWEETDLGRAPGGGGEDYGGCRRGEIRSMMLPEPVHVETDRLGRFDFFEDLAESFPVTNRRIATVGRDGLGEAGDS
jgi:hypothetical protein